MNLDLALFQIMNQWASVSTLAVVIKFCVIWMPGIFLLLLLYFLILDPEAENRRFAIFALGSAIIARFGFGAILKAWIARPRPFLDLRGVHQLIAESGGAMPSGHATFFFALATAVYMRDKKWGKIFYILATILSLARVSAGVHYLSDIVVGAILGSVVVFAISKYFVPERKRLVIFDLDGTLTESKASVTPEIASLLGELLTRTNVAIVSGGAFAQFEKQFLGHFAKGNLPRLTLYADSGSVMYKYEGGMWREVYNVKLTDKEKALIMWAMSEALIEVNFDKPAKLYGEQIEDRGSQITYSHFGQQAPVALKESWDKDRSKRMALVHALEKKLPDLEARSGGISSVDVTRKGINKAFAIDQMHDHLGIKPKYMLYVGDAIYKYGNDYLSERVGLDTAKVSGPVDTARVIRDLLRYNKVSC